MTTTSPSEPVDEASSALDTIRENGPGLNPGQRSQLERYLRERRALVDAAMARYFPAPQEWPKRLHAASDWTLSGGGKRLRPVLALASFEAVGGARDLPWDAVMPAACAVEMVHTYSLVHDDLPCMDDDSTRRGRPTTHVEFGEALALLAGDALLTEAFRLVLDLDSYRGAAQPEQVVRVGASLARAAGWQGMVGGQSTDLGFEQPVSDEQSLTFLHRRKTGELFRFSTSAGALLGGGTEAEIQALGEVGEVLGLAFQIADDLLDEEQDAGPTQEDNPTDTPSFPALIGGEASQERCQQLLERCLHLLSDFGEAADPLRWLAWFAVHRDH